MDEPKRPWRRKKRRVAAVGWLPAESPHPVRNVLSRTIELGNPSAGRFLRSRDHVLVWVNRDYGLTLNSDGAFNLRDKKHAS